jgi:hypothetical protein
MYVYIYNIIENTMVNRGELYDDDNVYAIANCELAASHQPYVEMKRYLYMYVHYIPFDPNGRKGMSSVESAG